MKKLDRFILISFIGPFITVLAVSVFVLMMQFLWLYIDELVGKGLSLSVILEFMMWGGCTILPLALPLSTLLASVMTIGSMAEHGELIAIKSSGVSVMRIFAPLIAASAIISVGAFFAGNNLVPKAYNEIFTLRDDIGRTKDEIKIPPGIFYDGIDGYILRVDETDKETGMMYGVMVYDHTAHKGNVTLTMADSAIIKMSKAKDYLIFTMYNGDNYQEDNTWNYRDTTFKEDRISFERQELVISLKNYAFEKSDSSRFGDQAKSMKLSQLHAQQDSLNRKVEATHDKHYAQLYASRDLVFRSQLDTSKALPEAVYSNEEFMVWKDIKAEIAALTRAIENCSSITADLAGMSRDAYEHLFYLRRTDLEIYKKYAQALACLILFFIGAPLGALIKKGGLGINLIVSALMFVLYWVVDISGTKLARDGALVSYVGVFLSAVVLTPIGILLCDRAAHDSDVFNADAIKTWWRRLTSHIGSIFHRTRIVYMGTPEFAVAPLDALVSRGYKVVGVVTVADKPAGRGLEVSESAVKKYSVAHGIPVLQPLKLKDPEFLESLRAWKADLFVVVAFRMLPEEVWSMPKLGTFNLHAALLPQYRGAAPINWAVINGEKMTGVTTFMIDKNMDTGAILLREESRISDTDTAGDVHDRLMELGAKVVVETVEGIIERNIETRVQKSFIQGDEVLKGAPKLTRELCHIDWHGTNRSIYNLIRGLSPYPAAFTELAKDGEATVLKIYRASERPDLHAAPGTVLSDGKTYLAVATADGALSLDEIQLAGKKRMSAQQFLLGFREPESYTTA